LKSLEKKRTHVEWKLMIWNEIMNSFDGNKKGIKKKPRDWILLERERKDTIHTHITI